MLNITDTVVSANESQNIMSFSMKHWYAQFLSDEDYFDGDFFPAAQQEPVVSNNPPTSIADFFSESVKWE